jgi:transposase
MWHIEGKTLRAISRETGIHRTTIKRILAEGGPSEYTRKRPVRRPILGPFLPVIDQILKDDHQAPRKQRHSGKRIFDRLKQEHGYPGGYTQVRQYVAEVRLRTKEAFIPLEFGPGEAQVDWGEAFAFDLTGEPPEGARIRSRKVYLFILTLPFSAARFVAAFPRQTQEFFLEGHRLAFEFFGGCPKRIVYDNLKSAVTKVLRGRQREMNTTFKEFCERHLFEPAFCNVARGNEKGNVENGVKWARNNLFVPPPRFSDWDDFNESLAHRCREEWKRVVDGHERSIGERLDEERRRLSPLPKQTTSSEAFKPRQVNSLCLVRFDTNDYSAPCRYAYHKVVVRPTVGKVAIFHDDQQIAVHKRCYSRHKAIYEPCHYLALIERKPRALDYGAPIKLLKLDSCFGVLRRRLESGQIHSRGTREYIQVLRLLEDHSPAKVTRAVQQALELGVDRYEAIKSLTLCPPEHIPSPLDLSGRGWLAAYRIVPAPIARYGALVGQGGAR